MKDLVELLFKGTEEANWDEESKLGLLASFIVCCSNEEENCKQYLKDCLEEELEFSDGGSGE